MLGLCDTPDRVQGHEGPCWCTGYRGMRARASMRAQAARHVGMGARHAGIESCNCPCGCPYDGLPYDGLPYGDPLGRAGSL